MKGHNKKRNTGLLYEFLIGCISEALVEGNDRRARDAVKLIKRHFRRGTELYKEFRLFNALVRSTVDTEMVASRIISEARRSCQSYDVAQLDREKSLLIRGINHTLKDTKFYSRKVNEYRTYATIQTLLNDWRVSEPNITRMAKFEGDVIQWLMKEKSVNLLEEKKSNDVDALVVNLMIKRLNSKYKGLLTTEQRSLIKDYVFSIETGDESRLRRSLETLKESTVRAINNYEKSCPDEPDEMATVLPVLTEVRDLIKDANFEEINDDTLTRFLRISQLKCEIVEE